MLGAEPAESTASTPSTASPPPAGTVPVSFEAPSGKQLHITANGAQAGECTTPCTMKLAPGSNSLTVTGDFSMVTSIDVPQNSARVEIKKRSTGLAVTGLVLVGISLIDGAIVTANNSSDMTAAQAKTNLELAIGGLVFAVVGTICYFSAGSDEAVVHSEYGAEYTPNRPQIAFRGLDLRATEHSAAAVARWSF